mmetsp:Transcript_49156/g.79296  ORF Transcript_49156/g.79296 Transcript_49156/m.79296 type:complete len:83 (+) Transcript_49156:36-284(+)
MQRHGIDTHMMHQEIDMHQGTHKRHTRMFHVQRVCNSSPPQDTHTPQGTHMHEDTHMHQATLKTWAMCKVPLQLIFATWVQL